jgi:hypothetical protein
MISDKQRELIMDAAKASGGLSAQLTIARIYLQSSKAEGYCIDTVFEAIAKAQEYLERINELRGDLYTVDLEERRAAAKKGG